MDVRDLEKKLQSEGFRHTYIWQDSPNAYYPDHAHPVETAHIILDGAMTLTQGGRPKPIAPVTASTSLRAPCTPPRWAPRDVDT